MNYYQMRQEVAQAINVLIDNKESYSFSIWMSAMISKYGVGKRTVIELLDLRGFKVENDKVVEK